MSVAAPVSASSSSTSTTSIASSSCSSSSSSTAHCSSSSSSSADSSASSDDGKSSSLDARIPRGTRDSTPDQMTIREKCFSTIRRVFLRHGAMGIDTPVFELRQTLMGKYGEDSKLIYDLADQGGEDLSLRYDLTVPFARYLAMHQDEHPAGRIKRYHIAKVYRRDNPQMARGRFREFYQCDFDVAGTYPPMVPDAEVLKVVSEVLQELSVEKFCIKLNHRKLLDGFMEICGVPKEKFRPICSAIDKLDKETWETVREEMVSVKGLSAESAEKIGRYVSWKSKAGEAAQLVKELQASSAFQCNESCMQALNELSLLLDYLGDMNATAQISLDLSLARGLDYYTGVIYEVILTDTNQVGSIAAGGRYDTLVGMFCPQPIPAVGVSVGIERLLTILEEREKARGAVRMNDTQVYVCSHGPNKLRDRMRLANELWRAGINAEYSYEAAPRPQDQITFAAKNYVPVALFIGDDELQKNTVSVKFVRNKTTFNDVPRAEVVSKVRELLKLNDEMGPQPVYTEAKQPEKSKGTQKPAKSEAKKEEHLTEAQQKKRDAKLADKQKKKAERAARKAAKKAAAAASGSAETAAATANDKDEDEDEDEDS